MARSITKDDTDIPFVENNVAEGIRSSDTTDRLSATIRNPVSSSRLDQPLAISEEKNQQQDQKGS